jgi:hypothetical protein
MPLTARHKKYPETAGIGEHRGIGRPHGPGAHNPYGLDLRFLHFKIHHLPAWPVNFRPPGPETSSSMAVAYQIRPPFSMAG